MRIAKRSKGIRNTKEGRVYRKGRRKSEQRHKNRRKRKKKKKK